MFLLILTMFTLLINIHGKCPLGSIEINSDQWCYKFFANPDTFYNAEAQCQNFNGHLTSISNTFSNSDIASTLKQLLADNNANVWLGGNKQASSWSWTDGTPFSYTNWVKNQPGSNLCASILPNNGQWHGSDCSANLPYLCEVPKLSDGSCTNAAVTCPSPKYTFPCDSEWTYFNATNFCYKVFHNQIWTEAEKICVQNNAHLTSIHSTLENSFLVEFAQSGVNVTYNDNNWAKWQTWIGLYDQYGNGDFKWTDNSSIDFSNWGPGWPNKEGITTSVGLTTDYVTDRSGYFQHWYDDSGYQSSVYRAFVCKKAAQLS